MQCNVFLPPRSDLFRKLDAMCLCLLPRSKLFLFQIVQNEVVNSDPCGDDALSASIMFHECKFQSNDFSVGRSCHWVSIYFCSVAKYPRFFVHRYATGLSTFIYWFSIDLVFRDICICWIPIIHTSMCLFKEMFPLLVWGGGEAWKAECLCGDLWPELLQGFYFLTIFKEKTGHLNPPPIICIFYHINSQFF